VSAVIRHVSDPSRQQEIALGGKDTQMPGDAVVTFETWEPGHSCNFATTGHATRRRTMTRSNKQSKPDMETIAIGDLPMEASRIALGTWAMGGWMWGGSDERDAIRTIEAALDHGITLIDTAPVYGFGRAEEIVGKALAAGGRRDRVLVATKVGLDWRDGRPFRNASRARIMKEIDDSLRRLKTNIIDLYRFTGPIPIHRLRRRQLPWASCCARERFAPSA